METTLAPVVTAISDVGATLGGQVATVAGIGIALGAVGFGIRYLWRMFKGTAR